jgi:hypothetical protein
VDQGASHPDQAAPLSVGIGVALQHECAELV